MLPKLAADLRKLELELGDVAAWLKEYSKDDPRLIDAWTHAGGAWAEAGRAARAVEGYVRREEK